MKRKRHWPAFTHLLPANLDGTVHDDIRLREILALRLAFVLPSLLHCECAQHDSFRRANGRCTHRIRVVLVGRNVEESGDHGNTSVLDIGRNWILFVVDEVLRESVDLDIEGKDIS